MDEVTAYEQDILLVDTVPDDPELFDNLPKENGPSLRSVWLRDFGKPRPVEVTTSRKDGASLELEKRSIAVNKNFLCDSADIQECESRPWRPQCRSTSFCKQSNIWTPTDKQIKPIGQWDSNSNRLNGTLERNQPVQAVKSLHNIPPPLMTTRNGPWHKNAANMDLSGQKSNTTQPSLSGSRPYCWQYFSDSLTCGFTMCRFLHVPAEGDEKFCMDIVMQFTKNPMCLQKAGAVLTGYYQNNSPGPDFSMPVLTALFWALLKACMISDLFSVLSVSLVHKIVPSHEFLLALFNVLREKGLFGYVPELMQLTFKMANAGLVLSLDYLECVKNMPEFQQNIQLNSTMTMSGNNKLPLPVGAPFPEYLNFAQAILEIELCSKQEDWKRMGEVFKSICQTNHHPTRVERISARITVALLSESKDKLLLPFASFTETGQKLLIKHDYICIQHVVLSTLMKGHIGMNLNHFVLLKVVCQNEVDSSLVKNFLGRIGVSLMLRYHKTHQWAKGRRVVEVMSFSKINYSVLKGLFGNEDGASRCCLVTIAAELFFLSGSVEGALNSLRDNCWFLSSCAWPCQPADLESRSRVLRRIAEKTSHRDTLEVLSNLPGLKEPNDLVDISMYSAVFHGHLQVWVDRQILPVASDTVDFMLSKKLAVDYALLQTLVLKLGKQNHWLRAREVFKRNLNPLPNPHMENGPQMNLGQCGPVLMLHYGGFYADKTV
ncbi:protein TOPAZ1-like [Thalassophryne amazonica]|uniref:protein TOPAZ1-like n=1 Tax=Thalassophryne amazonica TaxID=390379 RepID=UPI001471149E|nr:protein TOPAZ1-like [Thalassophryne amazonica]